MCFILNSCFVSLRDMHTCLLYHNSCWVHSTVYSATCIHARFFTQFFEFTAQFTVLPVYMLIFSQCILSLQQSSQCYLHTCSFFPQCVLSLQHSLQCYLHTICCLPLILIISTLKSPNSCIDYMLLWMTAATKNFFIVSNQNLSFTLNQNINKLDVLKSLFSMTVELKCHSLFSSSGIIIFVVVLYHSETGRT